MRPLLVLVLALVVTGCQPVSPYEQLQKAQEIQHKHPGRAVRLAELGLGELEARAAHRDSMYARMVLGSIHVWASVSRSPLTPTFQADSLRGIRMLQDLAEAGHAGALERLGQIYLVHGRDKQTAMDYYRRAAELGSPRAQHRIGGAYAYGDGVKQDVERAVHWLTRAMEGNDENARQEAAQRLRADVHTGVIPDSIAKDALALAKEIG